MRAHPNHLATANRCHRQGFERLCALFDGLDAEINISDAETYEILFANKKVREAFDEKIIGMKCYETFQDLSHPCTFCTNKHIFGKNSGQTYEWKFHDKRNNRWYRCIDKAIKWNGGGYVRYEIATDITKQKKMEDALRENKEFFHSVVDNSKNAILILDDNFRITYANDEASRVEGKPRNEIIGSDFRKFLAEESKDPVQDRYLRRQRGEKPPPQCHFKIVRKDGEERDVEVKSEIKRHSCGRTSTIVQLSDVTEHKRMEEERIRFEERLSALNFCAGKLCVARDLNEVYELTLNAMERTLGFAHASFLIVDKKKLRIASQRGYQTPLTFQLPLNGSKRGITVKAAASGSPQLVANVAVERDYVKGAKKAPLAQSELAVPIIAEDEALGVLNVESEKPDAFDEKDSMLLQILASHAATAIINLKRRDQLKKLSSGLEYLMKSTVEVMHAKSMNQKLKAILKAIRKLGWRRAVISLRDENLNGLAIVTAGLTPEENRILMERKAPGEVWKERLGPKFDRYRIGEFYYLPWDDPWIRENVHGVPSQARLDEATTYAGVPSRLSADEMVDWHPQDMLYAPLRTPEHRVVGILSMDDPLDGRKPTKESLTPLELFLHKAAMIIEIALLIEKLREARQQLETYAGHLEQMVEERTRELRLSQEKLLKTQRLAVLGELAGMVGHDLRNPLTGIAGAAYYIKKKLIPKVDGKVAEMLELIEKNIDHSNKIINDLLDYSREVKLELVDTTPRAVVKEVLSLAKIPRCVRLTNRTRNSPTIKVDIEKMKRAFVNIIKNAIDAMPNGGELTIDCNELNCNVQFAFSDTGMGMTKENIKKLWTPLFTTKAKGMGFGLPICKRIVEAHGGTIRATSCRGKGTTFIVSIPCDPKIKEGGGELWIKVPESSLLTTTKT